MTADRRPAPLPPDRLGPAATEAVDLLRLVDRAIGRYGVPPEHPVLTGMREFRALPGALSESIVELDPSSVWRAARRLTRLCRTGTGMSDDVRSVDGRVAWAGPSREEFRRGLTSVTDGLSGPGPSTMDSLAVTAGYGAELAHWLATLRNALVEFFVRWGTGTDAVTVRSAPLGAGGPEELCRSGSVARSAAELGAHCYATLRPALAAGTGLYRRVAADPALDPLPTGRGATPAGPPGPGAFRAGAFRAE